MWISREIENLLIEEAAKRPAVIVTGARQAGKTSLLQGVFPKHTYVSLDVPQVADKAEHSGEEFLAEYEAPLILDEIQYAPKILRFLKAAIDRHRSAKGQYLLTGSQKFSLMQGVTESLAGRVAVIDCHTLSTIEIERWSKKKAQGDQLLEWIWKGGYPELHIQDLDPARFFSDYLATYLERDVRSVLQVRSLRDFDRFMRLAAIRTGQLLSLNSFASDLGVSPNTIKSWLSVLEASNIIVLLEPYYRNLGKRLVKSPKLYFLDTGLLCFLAGLRSAKDLKNSELLGSIFETHVLGQMIRWHTNRGKRPDLYFYRDHWGHEVDFVIDVGKKLLLFECKWGVSPGDRVKGFEEVTKLLGEKNILAQTLITPARGMRKSSRPGLNYDDSIEIKSLSAL